jgi:hypothetical protein
MGSGRFVGGLDGTRGVVTLPGGGAPAQPGLLMVGGGDGWLGPVALPGGGGGCQPNTPGTVIYNKTFTGPIGGTQIFGDGPLLIGTITDIPTETINGGTLRVTLSGSGSASADCSGTHHITFSAGFDTSDDPILFGQCVQAVCQIPVLPPPPVQPFTFTDFVNPYADFPAPGCGVHQDLSIWILENFASGNDTTASIQNYTVTVTCEGP